MPASDISKQFDNASLLACFIGGVLYWAVHLLNSWLFQWVEISQHISLVYLPSFLRLANVLILGLTLGTASTALGGLFLIWWSPDDWLLSLLNLGVSANAAAIAVICMRILMGRRLSPARLMDLFLLSLLCAIVSASLHHLLWSILDTRQLVDPLQLPYMMLGDVNGALIGALILRWLSRNTRITQLLRQGTKSTH
jgi:hypothetical protein